MSNTPKPKKSQPEALPTDTGWRISDPGATQASLATRQFSLRGRCNFRGEIVHDGRAVRFESLLEYHTSLVLLADQRVANLVEQPAAIQYTAMDHCTHRHTFDFLVTLKDGRRIAVLVKPFRKANTIEFYDLIQRLKHALPGDFAVGIIVVTEANLSPARVADASLILAARSVVDPYADAVTLNAIRALSGRCSIGNVRDAINLGGRGFSSIIRAIDRGHLVVTDRWARRPLLPTQLRGDGRIDAYTVVMPASEVGHD